MTFVPGDQTAFEEAIRRQVRKGKWMGRLGVLASLAVIAGVVVGAFWVTSGPVGPSLPSQAIAVAQTFLRDTTYGRHCHAADKLETTGFASTCGGGFDGSAYDADHPFRIRNCTKVPIGAIGAARDCPAFNPSHGSDGIVFYMVKKHGHWLIAGTGPLSAFTKN